MENGLSAGSKGAMAELRVAIDLMRQGFWVFRAVSPNGPCDLVAIKHKKPIQIQVKTGAYGKDGSIISVATSVLKRREVDVVAVVLSNQVIYIPALVAFGWED